MHYLRLLHRRTVSLVKEEQGSSLLEFAITLPLLVVLIVGIYDFSGAFNQKQKIEQTAQEGAIIAGAQPMSDIASTTGNPDSLQPVVTAVFNSLAASGVLPNANQGSCKIPSPSPPGWVPAPPTGLTWTYTMSGCSGGYPGDNLTITINRGSVSGSGPAAVGTVVTVVYPYHWRFNSVIQLLLPGSSSYAATTQISESATVHNQM
jgi:TadE-like protein